MEQAPLAAALTIVEWNGAPTIEWGMGMGPFQMIAPSNYVCSDGS